MTTTYLEVIGAYGDKGWQDPDTAQEFFNDRTITEHGPLGKLVSEFEDGFPIIVQADDVVLIRRGFPRDWQLSITGVTVELNPLGFQVFELIGKNGMVRYRLLEDVVEWKHPPLPEAGETPANERLAKFQLGLRTYSKWAPVFEPDARVYHKTTTTLLQEPT